MSEKTVKKIRKEATLKNVTPDNLGGKIKDKIKELENNNKRDAENLNGLGKQIQQLQDNAGQIQKSMISRNGAILELNKLIKEK